HLPIVLLGLGFGSLRHFHGVLERDRRAVGNIERHLLRHLGLLRDGYVGHGADGNAGEQAQRNIFHDSSQERYADVFARAMLERCVLKCKTRVRGMRRSLGIWRHCERSEAIQSTAAAVLDCFVALRAPRNDTIGVRTRWHLAESRAGIAARGVGRYRRGPCWYWASRRAATRRRRRW